MYECNTVRRSYVGPSRLGARFLRRFGPARALDVDVTPASALRVLGRQTCSRYKRSPVLVNHKFPCLWLGAATLLGFSTSPPPYLQPDIVTGGPGILQGVNYASAAGGILNDTGKNYVGHLNTSFILQNVWSSPSGYPSMCL